MIPAIPCKLEFVDTNIDPASAARALLAFWRAAGVDMDVAEAVYAAAPKAAAAVAKPAPPITAPRPKKTVAAPVDAARALAATARTVAELRAAVEKFDGCALKATARNTVFSDGPDDAPVLIIGEAPDKEEDEQGKPFVGRNGMMLDRMLAQIGLNRQSNVLISNAIYWRPPGNRPPTDGEAMACLPFAERLIALTRPKLLILTGKSSAQMLLKRTETVAKLRGRRLSYTREGEPPVNAMVMLHPAYLVGKPQQKRLAWTDLLLAEAWLSELGVARAL